MNKMFNFNGMPYKRSGRAGGKSASMIGMLVLLLAALLVLPSCFDDDTETVEVPGPTVYVCPDGSEEASAAECPDDPVDPVAGYDEVGETAADDRYMDGDRDGMVAGTDGDDYIDGEGGNDSIKGMGGNDDITGGEGNDNLEGGEGNDKLAGDAGNDDVFGGAGDDELRGGTGTNTLDGGEGTDIAIYKYVSYVRVDLEAGTADHVSTMVDRFGAGTSGDTLISIENVKGSHGDDIINGNSGPNTLKGLDGADEINGRDGDDVIIPNRPANPGMAAEDIRNVANEEDGGGTDGADVVSGGAGSDTISYEGEAMSVSVNLSAPQEAVEDNESTTDVDETAIAHVLATVNSVEDMITVDDVGTEEMPELLSTVENITGGTSGDTLTGDKQDNTLSGGLGDDTLKGMAGDDTLIGGPGDDTLGNATADADPDEETGDDTIMGGDGEDTINAGGGDDTINGGDGDDNVNGGPGSDMIYAGVGDTVDGGNGPDIEDDPDTMEDETRTNVGVDTVSYAMQGDTNPDMDGDQGITITLGGGGQNSVANAELVIGSPFADTITGSSGRDFIMGGDGGDTLSSGGGGTLNGNGTPDSSVDDFFDKDLADVLAGMGGDDMLMGGAGVDVFAVHNGAGNDTIAAFGMGVDHLHLLDFSDGASAHNCALTATASTVLCTLSSGQTVTIGYTGDLTDPLDLTKDLNIVVVAPES